MSNDVPSTKKRRIQPRNKATITAAKGGEQKELHIAAKSLHFEMDSPAGPWQLAEAKAELLGQGGPGSLACPSGLTDSNPSLLCSFRHKDKTFLSSGTLRRCTAAPTRLRGRGEETTPTV